MKELIGGRVSKLNLYLSSFQVVGEAKIIFLVGSLKDPRISSYGLVTDSGGDSRSGVARDRLPVVGGRLRYR